MSKNRIFIILLSILSGFLISCSNTEADKLANLMCEINSVEKSIKQEPDNTKKLELIKQLESLTKESKGIYQSVKNDNGKRAVTNLKIESARLFLENCENVTDSQRLIYNIKIAQWEAELEEIN